MAIDAWDALRADLARGREQAFAELYDRCAGPMFRVARRMLGADADAEDAVHQAFLDLLRARRALANAEDPRAYAIVAARNAAAKAATRRGRTESVALEDSPEPAGEPEAADPGERDERLERELRALPAEQREALALRIEGELTFEAIGAALGVSPNTAASRVRYALERLRSKLAASTDGGRDR